MSGEMIREKIGGIFLQRGDGWWLYAPLDKIREVAFTMRDGGARFAAILAVPAGDGIRLSWHWDLGGTLMSVEAKVPADKPIPSIVDICPGADWAEREARDYYAITFEGRELTPPLMLRETDSPGVLLRSERRNP